MLEICTGSYVLTSLRFLMVIPKYLADETCFMILLYSYVVAR